MDATERPFSSERLPCCRRRASKEKGAAWVPTMPHNRKGVDTAMYLTLGGTTSDVCHCTCKPCSEAVN